MGFLKTHEVYANKPRSDNVLCVLGRRRDVVFRPAFLKERQEVAASLLHEFNSNRKRKCHSFMPHRSLIKTVALPFPIRKAVKTPLHICSNNSSNAPPHNDVNAFTTNSVSYLLPLAVLASLLVRSNSGAKLPIASISLATTHASVGYLGATMSSMWTGLAAGFLHTLCGPDHLVALSPLTIGRKAAVAACLGGLWGLGHSTGQLLLGLVFSLLRRKFRDLVPEITRWSGAVVASTLVAIGVLGINEWVGECQKEGSIVSDKPHDAGESSSSNDKNNTADIHKVNPNQGSPFAAKSGNFFGSALGVYATGVVYGLQPDALFVVVPALTLPTRREAIAYCISFVVGTVVAMGGYTFVIGSTTQALAKERPWLQKHLSLLASVIAVAMGLFMLFRPS